MHGRSGRGGDAGYTSLGDGSRVAKDSARVAAYGAVDELDAFAGLARATTVETVPASEECDLVIGAIEDIQNACWVLAACLADPARDPGEAAGEAVNRIESRCAEVAAAAGPVTSFVSPGTSRAEATLHVARTVCRRAERLAVALYGANSPGETRWELRLLNRMSELLFNAARLVLKCQGIEPALRGASPAKIR